MFRVVLALCAVGLTELLCVPRAHAQIVKCASPSGQITYTTNVCPAGTSAVGLPQGVRSDTGPSNGRQAERPLSPRAAELKREFDSCISPSGRASDGCRHYTSLERSCTNRENWDTPDCAAMREVNASFVSSLGRTADTLREEARDDCQDGDTKACDRAACPMSLVLRGTAAEVRACSRSRNLASSSTWAQWDESGEGEQWSGTYVCLQFVEGPNAIGQTISLRPTVSVRHASSGGYRSNRVANQTFATPEEAATTGCAAVIAEAKTKTLPL